MERHGYEIVKQRQVTSEVATSTARVARDDSDTRVLRCVALKSAAATWPSQVNRPRCSQRPPQTSTGSFARHPPRDARPKWRRVRSNADADHPHPYPSRPIGVAPKTYQR